MLCCFYANSETLPPTHPAGDREESDALSAAFATRVEALERKLVDVAGSWLGGGDPAAGEAKVLKEQLKDLTALHEAARREAQAMADALEAREEEDDEGAIAAAPVRGSVTAADAAAMTAAMVPRPESKPAKPPGPAPAKAVAFESRVKTDAAGLSPKQAAAAAKAAAAAAKSGGATLAPPGPGSLRALSSSTGTAGGCGSWLKVYMYEFPEALSWKVTTAAFLRDCRERNKCDSQFGGENLLAQFSLELILHDFFAQSCVRTRDPEEAHLFYVPFFHDVE